MLKKNYGFFCPVCGTGKFSDGADNLLPNKQQTDQGIVVGDKGAQASAS